jgi:hypothetical protein
MNMQSGFDIDPRTFRIINRMLEKDSLADDTATLEGAFFDYVLKSIYNN